MKMTPRLQKEFDRFCEEIQVPFFNRAMRLVIFEFLKTKTGRDDLYTPKLLDNINSLYRVLDAIEDTRNKELQAEKITVKNKRIRSN